MRTPALPRRAFLGHLAGLPLIGAAHATDSRSPADKPAVDGGSTPLTLADCADSEFAALAAASDLSALRSTYMAQWPTLGLAFGALTKDAAGVATIAGEMMDGDDAGTLQDLIDSFGECCGWLQETADVLRSAQFRLMCGIARAARERGVTEAEFAEAVHGSDAGDTDG